MHDLFPLSIVWHAEHAGLYPVRIVYNVVENCKHEYEYSAMSWQPSIPKDEVKELATYAAIRIKYYQNR